MKSLTLSYTLSYKNWSFYKILDKILKVFLVGKYERRYVIM